MRGSFGGGGRGMGGGPGGGGMRAIGRIAAKTGVRGSGGGGIQDPFSASSKTAAANSAPTSPRKDANKVVSKNQLSLSSSPLLGVPLSGPSTWQHDDDYFWVSSDIGSEESEDETANVYLEKFLLGPVPSRDEVHSAVSAIQQVFDSATTPQFIRDRFGPNLDMDVYAPPSNGMMMQHVSSKGSDLDLMEPAFSLSNSRSLSPYGYGSERALDAFQLLQTDSSVQKMVVSLSQDRAVWDAILNNDMVRELRESCHEGSADVADETCDDSSKERETNNPVVDVVMQMFGHTKAKFTDMIEKITKLVTHLFSLHSPASSSEATGPGDLFEAKVRASFMLTVVVLLTVVLSRGRGT